MYKEGTNARDAEFKYKSQIRDRVEELMEEWLHKVVEYKNEEEC
jgi:hypothetical protein